MNKVSTAVQLRFNIPASAVLGEEVKQRLARLAGKRATSDGILIIEARSRRTQEQNREEAIRRFHALLDRAKQAPKTRTPTRPTRAAKEKRLVAKKQRGTVKQLRRKKDWE